MAPPPYKTIEPVSFVSNFTLSFSSNSKGKPSPSKGKPSFGSSFTIFAMGLSTIQPITLSKPPKPFTILTKPSHTSLNQTPITPKALLLSRSIFLRNLSRRAIRVTKVFDEKRDGVVIIEADKNGYSETVENEEPKEGLPLDGEGLPLELLEKLNFDTNDTGSIVLYGGGAIAALWLTSAVIGAIDSIPVFPKLLEVVGLGYTLWFTSRYLLFKKNRDELSAKIEELKEQVLGSEDY